MDSPTAVDLSLSICEDSTICVEKRRAIFSLGVSGCEPTAWAFGVRSRRDTVAPLGFVVVGDPFVGLMVRLGEIVCLVTTVFLGEITNANTVQSESG